MNLETWSTEWPLTSNPGVLSTEYYWFYGCWSEDKPRLMIVKVQNFGKDYSNTTYVGEGAFFYKSAVKGICFWKKIELPEADVLHGLNDLIVASQTQKENE